MSAIGPAGRGKRVDIVHADHRQTLAEDADGLVRLGDDDLDRLDARGGDGLQPAGTTSCRKCGRTGPTRC